MWLPFLIYKFFIFFFFFFMVRNSYKYQYRYEGTVDDVSRDTCQMPETTVKINNNNECFDLLT